MKIILINGQSGTGKSTIADNLKGEIENSAWIDADPLVSVHPFELEKLDGLMIQNAMSLITNFSKADYTTIVTSGLTRNQKLLDEFIAILPIKAEIVLVWLRADKEVRLARKHSRARDESDSKEMFDFIDTIYPDVDQFDLREGVYLEIDTTAKKVEDVVGEIKKII